MGNSMQVYPTDIRHAFIWRVGLGYESSFLWLQEKQWELKTTFQTQEDTAEMFQKTC